MRGLWVALWIGLMFASGGAWDPDDCLLEKEDRLFRQAEGLKDRYTVLSRAMERRLAVLRHRHGETGADAWQKTIGRDKLLAALDEYGEGRLLRDYVRILRLLLQRLEDAYSTGATPWSQVVGVLRSLQSLTDRHDEWLTGFAPHLADQPEARPWLEEARTMVRLAREGAARGLTVPER